MPLVRKDPAAKPAVEGDAFGLLKSGDAEARFAAARTLATLPGGVEALGEAVAAETAPRVREAIFTALARAATPRSAQIVAPFIRSEDADVRTLAIDALNAMPEATTVVLPQLLADPDPDVRLLSCELARTIRSGEAAAQLCELLDREQEHNVCGAAVEVLAEIGDSSSIAALRRCGARFPDDPFLTFAIKAVVDQWDHGSTSTRG